LIFQTRLPAIWAIQTRKIFIRNFPCLGRLFPQSPSQAMQIFAEMAPAGLAGTSNQLLCTENKGLSLQRVLKLSLANFRQSKHSSLVRAILRAWEDL
jgi:hypothetical protein